MFFLLVFLDKFILHDLIAFLAMGGEKRTILSFDGRHSKRKGVLWFAKFAFINLLSCKSKWGWPHGRLACISAKCVTL